jgi:hypothetical protein
VNLRHVLAALFGLYFSFWELCFAHSGGLDANGCHAGSQPYHCHRSASEMVGNRLRCDLGSESKECDSAYDETPLPVPELPRPASSNRPIAPEVTVADAAGCLPGALAFEGLCISAEARATRTTGELVDLIRKFKAENRISSFQSGDLRICEAQLREKDGDIFRLSDGAIVDKTSYGYVGYQSYGTNLIYTYSDLGLGHLLLEDEEMFEIEILKESASCSSPGIYDVEAVSSSKVIINDEVFGIWGLCSGMNEGDSVVFSDSSASYGACLFTTVLNLSSSTSCQLTCE